MHEADIWLATHESSSEHDDVVQYEVHNIAEFASKVTISTYKCHKLHQQHCTSQTGMAFSSAVTVSIFGFAVGFGRLFYKNRGSGSVFIGPDFNHVQSRERTIVGSVSYRNRYWVYRIKSASIVSGKPTLRASLQIPQLISDNRLHYTG